MNSIKALKALWKKLGCNGHVKNFSSRPLWVLETDSEPGKAVAHRLLPGRKSPPRVDADAFRRADGKPIDGHASWWKFYDVSTVEVFDHRDDIQISVVAKTSVFDSEFSKSPIVYDQASNWGLPIRLVTDVRRDKKRRPTAYLITGVGWVDPQTFLVMTCSHEVDNARPVFPKGSKPYVRTRRDPELANNISVMG